MLNASMIVAFSRKLGVRAAGDADADTPVAIAVRARAIPKPSDLDDDLLTSRGTVPRNAWRVKPPKFAVL